MQKKKTKCFEFVNHVSTMIEDETQYRFIILRSGFEWNPDSYITLSHEILHLCQFYLKDFFGDERENEAEAYFHSHIMRQCLRFLEIEKKKLLKKAKNA